tara:strand:+ start:4974 stop:5273 length:300 start_codon:yes stop_codon:yes gene_type:complete
MTKILNLSARLTTQNVSTENIKDRVKEALSGIENVLIRNLKLTDINHSQERLVRASLDLMLDKIEEQDESAEEHLAAYCLSLADVDKNAVSDTINAIFP